MARTKVVTAYVDLGLSQRPPESFHALGDRLIACCPNIRVFRDFPFSECWLNRDANASWYPPANERAPDRFANCEEHWRSNVLQHTPVQWVEMAAAEDPEPDVFVWIGYSVFKQGDFTGKPVRQEDVCEFLTRVEKYPFGDIPFPGIAQPAPVLPHGNNWRFCGSTVIFPRRYLSQMVKSYKYEARAFLRRHNAIPLDLAIWPAVEQNSGLPFRFYQAEYDRTQFTGFPG
jgi:hypothetical protein